MAEDFFAGVQQVDAKVGDLAFRTPILIRDSRIISAVFPTSAQRLRKLIGDRGLQPAQMLPGIGMVQLTAYEHRDSDIGPFNEFSIVIPLYSPRFPNLPIYNLYKSSRVKEVHNFLLHRATDSETAVRILGDYFNWPQFLASFSCEEDDDWVSCEVEDDAGLICRLRGRKVPSRRIGVVRILVYTAQQPQPQRADINPEQSATTREPGKAELTLGGSHPIAVELSETLRSTKPRIYNYGPRWQFMLYGPEASSHGLSEDIRGEQVRKPR